MRQRGVPGRRSSTALSQSVHAGSTARSCSRPYTAPEVHTPAAPARRRRRRSPLAAATRRRRWSARPQTPRTSPSQAKRPLDRNTGESRRRPRQQIDEHDGPNVTTGLIASSRKPATTIQPRRSRGQPPRPANRQAERHRGERQPARRRNTPGPRTARAWPSGMSGSRPGIALAGHRRQQVHREVAEALEAEVGGRADQEVAADPEHRERSPRRRPRRRPREPGRPLRSPGRSVHASLATIGQRQAHAPSPRCTAGSRPSPRTTAARRRAASDRPWTRSAGNPDRREQREMGAQRGVAEAVEQRRRLHEQRRAHHLQPGVGGRLADEEQLRTAPAARSRGAPRRRGTGAGRAARHAAASAGTRRRGWRRNCRPTCRPGSRRR